MENVIQGGGNKPNVSNQVRIIFISFSHYIQCSAVSAHSAVCQASSSRCDKSPAGSLVKNTDVL